MAVYFSDILNPTDETKIRKPGKYKVFYNIRHQEAYEIFGPEPEKKEYEF